MLKKKTAAVILTTVIAVILMLFLLSILGVIAISEKMLVIMEFIVIPAVPVRQHILENHKYPAVKTEEKGNKK